MKADSKKEWALLRKGILELWERPGEKLEEEWAEAGEHTAYFGYAESHLWDALVLFALEENELAERLLDFSLRCLEKAEEIDDCNGYGERYERVEERTENGQSYTSFAFTNAADDGAEPFQDEELGRAMRTRMLFTCRWLKTGHRDEALLKRMVGHLRAWLDIQAALPPDSREAQRTWDPPRVHIPQFTQWCVEEGEYELGKKYCRKYAGRDLSGTPVDWRFTRNEAEVFYLLAVHLSGERDLSQLFPEALDKHYRFICRKIGIGASSYHVNEDTLGLAYLRAEKMGLGTEARELLRRIREDS
jgi:hypothetical protein